MFNTDACREALENAIYTMVGLSPYATIMEIGPVKGFHTAISSPWLNFVNVSAPYQTPVDNKTIQQVTEYFSSKQKSFSWLVSDANDHHLRFQLPELGFNEMAIADGLVYDLTQQTIPVNDNQIEIRQAHLTDRDTIAHLNVTAFGLTPEVSTFYSVFCDNDKIPNYHCYLAYLDTYQHPVSYGAMMYLPNTKIALLCGAGTLPDYRGQGGYKALLHRRLQIAKQDGIEAVIMQAISTTSSPICQRYGFKKIYQQNIYACEVLR